MAPLRGWGPRGQRLEASVPFGHWKTMTFIAALRHDRITAPWVIDGPINGELFTLYVENELAPTLAKGDIVILDNLGSHKGKRAREIIRARGAHLLFLPPYSPDLNPIEQVFAKLKHLMRAAEPRTIEETWRKAGRLLDLSSAEKRSRSLPHYRGNLEKGRKAPRPLLRGGVCELSQKLRICFRIKTSCSSDPASAEASGRLRLHTAGGLLWRFRAVVRAERRATPISPAFCMAHARRGFFELADIAKAARDG